MYINVSDSCKFHRYEGEKSGGVLANQECYFLFVIFLSVKCFPQIEAEPKKFVIFEHRLVNVNHQQATFMLKIILVYTDNISEELLHSKDSEILIILYLKGKRR